MRSLALTGNEIADGALRRYPSSGGTRALPEWGRRYQPFGDETVQWTGPVHRDKSCNGSSVVGDRHLVAASHNVKVSTEVVS